jgi:hypothetical protein
MDATPRSPCTEVDWFPNNHTDCEQNLVINEHLGAQVAMSPGRVHDPEGAKTRVISYTSTAGATAAVIKLRFQITCYTKPET